MSGNGHQTKSPSNHTREHSCFKETFPALRQIDLFSWHHQWNHNDLPLVCHPSSGSFYVPPAFAFGIWTPHSDDYGKLSPKQSVAANDGSHLGSSWIDYSCCKRTIDTLVWTGSKSWQASRWTLKYTPWASQVLWVIDVGAWFLLESVSCRLSSF